MKRMTVIAGYMVPGTSDTKHIVAVKGAPETLKIMVGINHLICVEYTLYAFVYLFFCLFLYLLVFIFIFIFRLIYMHLSYILVWIMSIHYLVN